MAWDVYEKLDQPDEIKVKCKDFPVGKALSFLKPDLGKGRGDKGKREVIQKGLSFRLWVRKKSKLDPRLPLCMEKLHQRL